MDKDKDKRIKELEGIVEQRDATIKELREDVHNSWSAVSRANAQIEEWMEFWEGMTDSFHESEERWQDFCRMSDERNDLIAQWNTFTPKYNEAVAAKMRNLGRPLAASPAQKADVLKRHKAGQSLRGIADETNLGVRTVRTIIDKESGVDRATLARLKRIKPDKMEVAHYRVVKSTRKAFPKQSAEAIKECKSLRKELNGLGKALA